MSKCAMNFAPRRKSLGVAGDPVVEARADREQEITVVDRIVRECGAVHPEHAHRRARPVVSTAPMPMSVVTTGI